MVSVNLKKYRKIKGLTQEVLSESASISRDYLSELERGKRFPRLVVVDRLAAALDIDAYKLFMP
ncbi:MAG: helix-turn-helix domain-containing protein [Candidatus Gastranaerophilaceae bacterium]